MSQYTFKIPASTPPGQYLLRIGHIALHGAGTVDGAQFYIACTRVGEWRRDAEPDDESARRIFE